MNKDQERSIKRGDAVHQVFVSYDNLVKITPGLTDDDAQLVQLLTESKEFALQQTEKSKPVTEQKNANRSDVEKQSLAISSALVGYGSANGDEALKLLLGDLRVSRSKLESLRDRPLHTFAAFVHQTAAKYPGKLMPYITDQEVANFKTLVDAYDASLPAVKNAQGKSKQITSNLLESCDAIDDLLKGAIRDKVRPWQFKQPDFYNAFENAMAIGENRGGKSSKKEENGTPEK
jgi:hypothetical protein